MCLRSRRLRSTSNATSARRWPASHARPKSATSRTPRPTIAIRTGDTPQLDRARFRREPADILITTPESLYLLLTSQARDALRSIDTVIVDEIHALVPTKRGAHLALSLERLAAICEHPPQRIGLSATQRPLDEVARFLGGADPRKTRRRAAVRSTPADLADEFASNEGGVPYRPVTIVDAGQKKPLKLSIEVPLDQNRGNPENPGTLRTPRTSRTPLSGPPFTRACSSSSAATGPR